MITAPAAKCQKHMLLVVSSTREMAENSQDAVELMLKKTGCIELHYKVQECIAETSDWRRCQDQVKQFKECMQAYVDKQGKKYENITKI